jgi:hypothetical protein
VNTIGINEDLIRKYVQYQEEEEKEKKPKDKNSCFLTEVSKNGWRALPSFFLKSIFKDCGCLIKICKKFIALENIFY